jgi:hypothetical protein
VSRQFLASVFGMTLVVKADGKEYHDNSEQH